MVDGLHDLLIHLFKHATQQYNLQQLLSHFLILAQLDVDVEVFGTDIPEPVPFVGA